MKLFLSSYRAGTHNAELLKLLGGIKKVAFISNAKDYKSPDERQEKIKENFDFWRSISIEPTEIDLRPHFNKPGAEALLDGFEFVWMAGGNVFLLRRALKYTGLDKSLVEKVKNGELIYGGESAGAILAGPTLRHSEMESPDHEDSPTFVPEGYKPETIWEGLGLVDFVPVPHYKTEDYGQEIDHYIARLDEEKIPHQDMTDDQAILIDHDKMEFLK